MTIGELVDQAWKRAGLVEISQTLAPSQLTWGQRELTRLLRHLPAKGGPMARTQSTHDVLLAVDVLQYTLPVTIVDLLDPAMLIAPGQPVAAAAGETAVRLTDQRGFQVLSSKDAVGRPILFYPDRTANAIVVNLWPTPSASENLGTIRFRTIRALGEADDANDELDLAPHWETWVVLALGAELAAAASVEGKAQQMAGKAEMAFLDARAQDTPRTHGQMVVMHETGWEGR